MKRGNIILIVMMRGYKRALPFYNNHGGSDSSGEGTTILSYKISDDCG